MGLTTNVNPGAVDPKPVVAATTQIEYSDFQKVELRAGKVVTASRVEGSEEGKLLKLSVDFAEAAPRQVVAGIGLSVTPESLVGKNFVFVTNLKPRKLMGLESQAMILAAGPDPKTLSFVATEAAPGLAFK